MKKLLLISLVLVAGCGSVWDASVFGRRQRNIQQQDFIKEKFEVLYAEAEKNGDTELCIKILETYTNYLSQLQLQPRSVSQSGNSGQQWLQQQETMNQLRRMEHNASFDRMMRGGLP